MREYEKDTTTAADSQTKIRVSIDSVDTLHRLIGIAPPQHPLISLIDSEGSQAVLENREIQVETQLYVISLKEGRHCSLRQGRRSYDFQEGSLSFLSPGQVVDFLDAGDYGEPWAGWLLCFHPDLIRQTGLGKRIADYRFFSYQGNEALHLSDAEKFSITDLVRNIQKEYASRTDEYSYNLLVSQIELLLNYCQRYYGRQFLSRKPYEKSAVEDFFLYLNQCFDSNEAHCEGLPSVKDCALKLCYSPDYLSDLLRAETGMGAQEHIYRIFVHRAKDLLVSSEDRVNQIAYRLGFAYPQHFSRLFKMRTGLTPGQYRESVL